MEKNQFNYSSTKTSQKNKVKKTDNAYTILAK